MSYFAELFSIFYPNTHSVSYTPIQQVKPNILHAIILKLLTVKDEVSESNV